MLDSLKLFLQLIQIQTGCLFSFKFGVMNLVLEKRLQYKRNLMYEYHANSMEPGVVAIWNSCLRRWLQYPTITLLGFHILIVGKKRLSYSSLSVDPSVQHVCHVRKSVR
jgi:hypothetical protein